MQNSEETSPALPQIEPSDDLINYLSFLENHLIENDISSSNNLGIQLVTTSGSAASSDYMFNAQLTRKYYPEDVELSIWVDDIFENYQELREKTKRSEKVNFRLAVINERLKDLHSRAIESAKLVSANVKSPIECAGLLRELIDGFKGELIRVCKTGKGSSFIRISNNLALQGQTHISNITDQDKVYNQLHHELSEIVKDRIRIGEKRMDELLSLVEDHILNTTNSLDPEKSGISINVD